MIALFTDFGLGGPYVGKVHAVLHRRAPGIPIVDVFHDVPNHNIRAGAYLLPAYTRDFPVGTVFVCVVDPGVGSARRALMLEADGRWYVGPDNGLLQIAARRAHKPVWHEILWRPESLSATFHGRDLFAPVAAELAQGRIPKSRLVPAPTGPFEAWPEDMAEIVYIDHYGNALSGLHADRVSPQRTVLQHNGARYRRAGTYAEVPPGEIFWYVNANGLVEMAANGCSAAQSAKIRVGDPVLLE